MTVARSFRPRLLGLMFRREFPKGSGILFPGASAIHTFFVRFPIDVVYLDAELKVRKIVSALRPWRFSSGGRGVSQVLELPAGACADLGLREGDALAVESP